MELLPDLKIDFNGSPDEKREYINVKDAARLSVECIKPEYKKPLYSDPISDKPLRVGLIILFIIFFSSSLLINLEGE